MSKRTLRDWASVAEIIGSVAVVVSLLFVAYSINHNTDVLRSLNDNLLYEYDDRAIDEIVSDASMASILVKLDNAESLSAVERERFESYMTRYLNMWELAHDRYVEGLFPEEKWLGWSGTLGRTVTQGPRRLPKESWENIRNSFGLEFASIVDNAYALAE